MKMLVSAIALVVASPALAQTAPAGQHQGHQQGQHQGHGQHQQGQHQDHGQHGRGHGEHRDCCADRDGNGRMDCCEQAEEGQRHACCEERHGEASGNDGR